MINSALIFGYSTPDLQDTFFAFSLLPKMHSMQWYSFTLLFINVNAFLSIFLSLQIARPIITKHLFEKHPVQQQQQNPKK